MFDLSTIELDLSLSDEGVRVDVGDDAHIIVGRWGSRNFKRAVQKHAGNRMTQIQNKLGRRRNGADMSKEEQEALNIMAKIMADGVLLGWGGISLNGEVLEYSFDNAVKILSDERYESFRELVELSSKEEERFYVEQSREDEGNSQSGSHPNSE
jgi:hypothetical protein